MLDLLVTGARIITMDPERPRATRLGIWGGRIVGLDEDLDGLDSVEVLDLDGGTLLPGFIDAHTHLALTGQRMRAVDIGGLVSAEQALAVIAEGVATIPAPGWIEVAGYEHRLFGGVHLTADQLETAAPGRQVYVRHVSGHAGIVSHAVLAGIPAEEREADEKIRAGLLEEGELRHLKSQLLPYPLDQVKDSIRTAMLAARGEGITMCMDAGIGPTLGGLTGVDALAYQELLDAGKLPVRIQVMPELVALTEQEVAPSDGFRNTIPFGFSTGFGSDMLRIGAAKVVLDGGLMVHSAALTEDYADTGGRGELNGDPAELMDRIVDAHLGGWQVAIHAIGDRSLDLAIAALRRAAALTPRRSFPHRIEHASVVRPDQVAALGELGVAIVAQPCFVYNSTEEYLTMMGPERSAWLYRWRSLEEAGARVVGSTDRPLLGSPLEGIQSLVTRTSELGTAITPEERFDLTRAIEAWTVDGAWVAGMADRLGRLKSGFLADAVVLAADPYEVPAAEIRDIPVLGTIVNGSPAWN